MPAPRPRIGIPLGMVLVAILASAGVAYATAAVRRHEHHLRGRPL